MNVQIFNVLQKASGSFRAELGRQFLANTKAIRQAVKYNASLTETQFFFTNDPRSPSGPERWIVESDLASINQTISGNYNDAANIELEPSKINGVTNTTKYIMNVNDIRYGFADGGNVILKILRRGKIDFEEWQFNSTTLSAVATLINKATSNQLFSIVFGSCATSTQAVTYDTNEAVTMLLEAFNGASFVTIDSDAVSAGSGSHTFSFDPGDLVSGQRMRVSYKIGAQITPVQEGTFSCTGGSGSGSGSTGDCNMYAYFDGDGFNDALDLLNWGASCTLGYVIQVSTSSDFTDTDAYIVDTTTQSTDMHLTLTAGTYYARVRNISGQTRFSPTLTITAT